MNINRYLHYPTDSWIWRHATVQDIPNLVALSNQNYYQHDIDGIFNLDLQKYAHQLTLAAVNQYHAAGSEMLFVAVNKTHNQIIAYHWVRRGETMPFSQDEIATPVILQLDLALPARDRIALTVQSILQWETWAKMLGIPMIISTSLRPEYQTYMRIHEALGWTCRGINAYKKLSTPSK
jgi:hypothetical protein